MRELVFTNWRTTLLAVSILVGLLMFTQGKISTVEFLQLLGFFNVAGYLLARDARATSALVADEMVRNLGTPRPKHKTGSEWAAEIFARLVVGFIVVVLLLCFWPLMHDAVVPNPNRHYPAGGTPNPYALPPSTSPGLPEDDPTIPIGPQPY